MSTQDDKKQNGALTQEDLPVDWSTEPTPAYVSGAHCVSTPREFSLLFDESAAFPGRNRVRGESGPARSRIVASLRIPPDTFFQVVCAMASSWNRFVDKFLDDRMPRPKFKLIDSGEMQLENVETAKSPASPSA